MFIKKFVNRLLGRKNSNPLNAVEALVSSGNLTHGSNCNLKSLEILTVGLTNNHVNIKIGSNCFLACKIMLQTAKSEVIIGDGVFIGADTTLFCYDRIVFGNDIMVSWGCTFIDTNAHSLSSEERSMDVLDWLKGPQFKNWSVVKSSPIFIKDKCWVGFNSIVAKGVTLEEGTVIGCGSVVTKSTEPYSVNAGNPAVMVKKTI